jgi:allophanate hydrolase subunit 1
MSNLAERVETAQDVDALQTRIREKTLPELREIISGAWSDTVTRAMARRELESRLRLAAAAKAVQRGTTNG